MVGQVVAGSDGDDGIVVMTDLDPAIQPFLHDHRIDGTPVLPGVMGTEAFAEAAQLLAPGWQVEAIEDVEFLAPFKWYRDEPRRVEVRVRVHPDGGRLVADCRLEGRRNLPGQPEQVTTHFTGRVILGRTSTDLGEAPPPPQAGPLVTAEAIYRVYFHGPAYQVLAGVWRNEETTVGELRRRSAGEPRRRKRTTADRSSPCRVVLPDGRGGGTRCRRKPGPAEAVPPAPGRAGCERGQPPATRS